MKSCLPSWRHSWRSLSFREDRFFSDSPRTIRRYRLPEIYRRKSRPGETRYGDVRVRSRSPDVHDGVRVRNRSLGVRGDVRVRNRSFGVRSDVRVRNRSLDVCGDVRDCNRNPDAHGDVRDRNRNPDVHDGVRAHSCSPGGADVYGRGALNYGRGSCNKPPLNKYMNNCSYINIKIRFCQ